MGECYKKHTATFLIMGENCTRNCRFCSVSKKNVCALDINEPRNVADAAVKLGLRHVVVTSVTRDDLNDGGASHFAKTAECLRNSLPGASIELLVPDFQGREASLDTVINAKPDIFAHNLETVPRLYHDVRPMADYSRSLRVLEYVKIKNRGMITKTSLMLGLGETQDEVEKVMDDIVNAGCDIMTLGQYLRPSRNHYEVKEYITPEQFENYAEIGRKKGLRYVFAAPLVRSSYNAAEAYDEVMKKRG